MPQSFFTNTIESDFIKQLLNTTPIPTIDVVVKGRKIYGGFLYIYEGQLIKCTEDGFIGDGAKYEYIYSSDKNLITYNTFTSTVSYYDQQTHKHLGDYLRYYRDTTGVNLMPFYNCYNYDNFVDFYLTKEGYVEETPVDYKVLSVPVKMNATYTIAVDCPTEVLIKPVFHSDFGMIKMSNNEILSDNVLFEDEKSVLSFNNVSFKNPIVINTSFISKKENVKESNFYDNERYLYLAVQLPKNNKSSFVVLEGDWTKNYNKVFDANYSSHGAPSAEKQNELMYKNLSLLLFSTGSTYAFSDRLIEYLLLNAISSQEEIEGNIRYAQRNVNGKNLEGYTSGIWNDNIRAALWYKYKNNLYKKYNEQNSESLQYNITKNMIDMIGFVDKDMERTF